MDYASMAQSNQRESLGGIQQAQSAIPQQATPMARASQRAGEAGQILGHLIAELEKRLSPVLIPDSPAPTNGATQAGNGVGSMLSDALNSHAIALEGCGNRLRNIMDRLSI